MKFVAFAVFTATALFLDNVYASNPEKTLSKTLGKENEEYWARFLQDASMSVPAPTPGPSEPCIVEVDLDCSVVDGSVDECGDITQPPTDVCSGGECIERLTLTYISRTCDDSENEQGSDFECEEFPENSIPENGDALITCVNAERVFCNCTAKEGEQIVIQGPDGGCLPDDVTCSINNAADGSTCQVVTFDTSGEVSLSLKDSFGKLTVDGCDNGEEELDCLVEVDYTYTVSNTGEVDATITELERVCNGETLNLLETIPPDDPSLTITPGNTFVAREPSTVDACEADCQEKEVSVVAEAEDGSICEDDDELEFCIETSPPNPSPTSSPQTDCEDVEASISCTTTAGLDCENIVPPDETCSGGECIERLTLSYIKCPCEDSDFSQPEDSVTCIDFPENPIPEGGTALVTCVNADRIFCNCTVREGETIVIQGPDGGCLPDEVTCSINYAEDGSTCQEVTFDTSGDVPLNLKDKFGKLTVEGCDNGAEELDCLVEVDYLYTLTNNSPDPVTALTMIRDCDGETLDLLAELPPDDPLRVITTGNQIPVVEPGTIDACEDECIEKILVAEVEQDGEECVAPGDLDFCLTSGGPSRKLSDSQPAAALRRRQE